MREKIVLGLIFCCCHRAFKRFYAYLIYSITFDSAAAVAQPRTRTQTIAEKKMIIVIIVRARARAHDTWRKMETFAYIPSIRLVTRFCVSLFPTATMSHNDILIYVHTWSAEGDATLMHYYLLIEAATAAAATMMRQRQALSIFTKLPQLEYTLWCDGPIKNRWIACFQFPFSTLQRSSHTS